MGHSETEDGDKEQQNNDVTGEKTLKDLKELVEETGGYYQSLVEEARRLGNKSKNQEHELNARIHELKGKDTEIDTYKQIVTDLKKKYKATRDQAAETQRQNDELRLENQALRTQMQDVQTIRDKLKEQNITLKRQRRQVDRLRAALVIQRRRKKVLIRTCRQLRQQQNNISLDRDNIRQQNGDLLQEFEKEVDFLIHQICALTEPADLSSLPSRETTEPDKTSSTGTNLEKRFQHRKHSARNRLFDAFGQEKFTH